MSENEKLANLAQLFDRIEEAAQGDDRITFNEILEPLGARTFGPLLLIAGLITLSPIIGDIPGVPTLMALFVVLTAGQLLLGRKQLWLPRWLLQRSVPRDKLRRALAWLRGLARVVDRLLRPRLTVFTHAIATYVIAIVCIAIAAVMPIMELIPFSANIAGAALTAFGLALISDDGLLALLAFMFAAGAFGFIVNYM